MKKALIILTLILLGLGAGLGVLISANNAESTWPDRTRLQTSYDDALGWLEANREAILNHANPALWWMIQRSLEINHNPRLADLFQAYEDRYLQNRTNLWYPLFYPGRWVPFNDSDLIGFDDYQLHFVYGISCDEELGRTPLLQAQLDPDYCDGSPLRPACVTHQLIGFRFMQRSRCGDAEATQQAIIQLQDRIVTQLTLDPRVVDVYMQRVMMLLETAAPQKVKPIWLNRLLDAQQPDGGWSDFQPLLHLTGDTHLGFYARGIKIASPRSDFHMTAQGILLLSLALYPDAVRN